MRFRWHRAALAWLVLGSVGLVSRASWAEPPAQPNFVVIFCDDLGYGDLGCYGHPTIRTPHIDRMAVEGIRMTQFYCAAPVCTPSRAALLTGRLPIRSGMCSNKRRVLFADSKGGLPKDEVTIAAALKRKGYATACIGKWHLGHLPQYLPVQRGFDDFFGAPYSNDMKPFYLIRGSQEVERPVDQTTLTRRYTEAAVEFIRGHRETPFFLYLAHAFPHTPLHASADFKGRSPRGLYGDVVEELDWSTGQILRALREFKLADRTMVVFTSDNGPWLIKKLDGGSAGLLRGGKGSTWEGGMRVPGIFWWPGKIAPGGVRRQVASTMDLFATMHRLAGIDLPPGRTLDSHDLSPILFADGVSTRQSLFYYRGQRLMAVRHGPWKAHLFTQPAYGPGSRSATPHDPPLLYNLDEDPSEQYDVAPQHADVVEAIRAAIAVHLAGLKPAPSQLEKP